MSTRIQYALLALIGLFLLFPLANDYFRLTKPISLQGVQVVSERPSLTWDTWLSGKFQSKFDKWFGQNFGLRGFLIKTSNQIHYSVFRDSMLHGEGIIVGKDDQLLGKQYIESYLQYAPPEDLTASVRALANLQKLLKDREIGFVLLITSSKESIYPEYIPDDFLARKHFEPGANYHNFVSLLNTHKINYVNGRTILEAQKRQQNYPIFPHGGYHWNNLGAYFVTKALLKELDQILGKPLVDIELSNIATDYLPTGSDRDLVDLLNVWVPPDKYLAVHPQIVNLTGFETYSPRLLIEGGSFCYQILDILKQTSKIQDLTYYNYYAYRLNYSDKQNVVPLPLGTIDWEQDVFNRDAIILELNELYITGNPDLLASGFVKDAIIKLEANGQSTKH